MKDPQKTENEREKCEDEELVWDLYKKPEKESKLPGKEYKLPKLVITKFKGGKGGVGESQDTVGRE